MAWNPPRTGEMDLNGLLPAVVDVAADSIAIIDASDSSISKKEAVADLVTAIAGDGLSATSGVLALSLNELTAAAVAVAADSIAIIDANDSNASRKEAIADVMTAVAGDGIQASSGVLAVDVSDFAGTGLEDDGSENLRIAAAAAGAGLAGGAGSALSVSLTGLTAAIVDVAADSIAIIDANDSNASRKEAVADLVSAMAGTGLSASSGVLSLAAHDLGGALHTADTLADLNSKISDANLDDSYEWQSGVEISAGNTLHIYWHARRSVTIESIWVWAVTAPVSAAGTYLLTVADNSAANLLAAASFDLETLVALTIATPALTATVANLNLTAGEWVDFTFTSTPASDLTGAGLYIGMTYKVT